MNEQIKQIAEKAIFENPSLFLVDLNISKGGAIHLVIDGDSGVPIEECVRISRMIENFLQGENYSIKVSSFDITKPLLHQRQYIKNIGRTLEVRTDIETFTGELCKVAQNHVLLKWKQREPKRIGKGKITVEKRQEILYQDIIQTRVKLKF